MRTTVTILATAWLATAALLTSGCTFGVVEQTRTRSATHTAGGWKTLKVKADSMSKGLSVKGGTGSECKVDATVAALVPEGASDDAFGDARLSFRTVGSVLELVTEASGDFAELLYFQGLSINTPSGVDLDLDADDTNVTVQGVVGAVKVRCGSGSADVNTAGSADITADSGAVKVEAGTTLKVKTSAGSIDGLSGSIVDIETDSGDAKIDTPAGGKLKTTSGAISLRFLGNQFGATTLDSTTGPIEVLIPKGSQYDLDVFSNTGPIQLQIGGVILTDRTYNNPVNGGGPVVSIRSDSGSITVIEQ